jgi:hypothetical protein
MDSLAGTCLVLDSGSESVQAQAQSPAESLARVSSNQLLILHVHPLPP